VDAPIGIFDSGVGGLTVARAVLDQLPHEPIVYVGDTAHCPYGPRPIAEVRGFALDVLDHLVEEHQVKLLVIACNAASSACLRDARERYAMPVVEVINPAVRRAVAATRNNKVGVIGTAATITSRSYDDAFAAAPQIALTTAACPRFVEFVEKGETFGDELLAAAEEYLAPLVEAGCDTLVLGCTHYPLLRSLIERAAPRGITVIDSAESTAEAAAILINGHAQSTAGTDLAQPVDIHCFATDSVDKFERLGSHFLGRPTGKVQLVDLGG
jgi:glutamate racemase